MSTPTRFALIDEALRNRYRITETADAEEGRRRANSYPAQYVSTGYRVIEPEFVLLERPIWQFVIQYKAPTLSPIRVGLLEVNALTGEVVAFTTNQIETIRERARAYLSCNTPSSAAAN